MKKYLSAVLELYEWELREIPFVNSVIGRHVYLCMARQILQTRSSEFSPQSVKALLSSPNFTDRAIRLKIREMERSGFLQSTSNAHDKRSKKLVATDKLVTMVDTHSTMLDRIMARDFFVVGR